MKTKTLLIVCMVFAITLCLNFASQLQLRRDRQALQIAYQSPKSMLPPEAMQLLAGEFKGLWADYTILEIGSYVGSDQKATPEDYQNIHRGLKQALALDPYSQQAYLLAQGLLPWKGRMYREAIDLLEISRQHRAWDWRPGHYIGFDYFYFLKDFAKASEVLLDAAKIKEAPVLLAVLGARFAVKGQRTEAAITLLAQMLRDEELSDKDRLDMDERLAALKGVQLLESAIERYRLQNGAYPVDLDTLVHQGIISAIPQNPYMDHYFYFPETGRVAFDDVGEKDVKNNVN